MDFVENHGRQLHKETVAKMNIQSDQRTFLTTAPCFALLLIDFPPFTDEQIHGGIFGSNRLPGSQEPSNLRLLTRWTTSASRTNLPRATLVLAHRVKTLETDPFD